MSNDTQSDKTDELREIVNNLTLGAVPASREDEAIAALTAREERLVAEAFNDIETVASDYRALGFNPDYQKIVKSWKKDHGFTSHGKENNE